ncbi:sigma-70 family RNA polymerase sigma factor [Tessaracoccus sp. Z1128]
MDFNALQLPDVWFEPGDDFECAKAVEAGMYASFLVQRNGPDPELESLVALGMDARDRLWALGLKVAMQQARRVAAAHGLPPEDLFQDGCVAVAEAIRRYDHTRAVRFSTFVFEFVFRALTEGARHRVGRPTSTRADRRAARLAGEERDRQGAAGKTIGIAEAAAAAGVSAQAVSRAMVRTVSLDDVLSADPAAEAGFARVDSPGLAFLELLSPRHRRVLEHRFGLNGEALTLAETARAMNASASTVHRWEREAVARARSLLDSERTAGISARSPRQPLPPSWTAPPSRSRTPRPRAAAR